MGQVGKLCIFLGENVGSKPLKDDVLAKNGTKKVEKKFEKVGLPETVETNDIENLINNL